MLTERQLVAGLNLIPLQDQKRFFATLGTGRFSKRKFASIIVSFAYAAKLVNVNNAAAALPANTGITQIAGGKDQQEEELVQAVEAPLQSMEGDNKQTIRQKIASALPYVTMAVGVVGLAANFYYTQIAAPRDAQKAYSEQSAECYSIGNYLTSSTSGCLVNAGARRELSLTKATQLAVQGTAVFGAIVLYGKKLRDSYISGGRVSRADVMKHMPLTGIALDVADVALDMFSGPSNKATDSVRVTPGRGRPGPSH